jgi:hypothetical protein
MNAESLDAVTPQKNQHSPAIIENFLSFEIEIGQDETNGGISVSRLDFDCSQYPV